ncbi:hypothetical protein D1007_36440 [Hordeum vulgare]|nr:hypothetical protein D1007_36440 [Hordeum vulgare]
MATSLPAERDIASSRPGHWRSSRVIMESSMTRCMSQASSCAVMRGGGGGDGDGEGDDVGVRPRTRVRPRTYRGRHDRDTVPAKYEIFVDHKDMNFDDVVVIDDAVIGGSPSLPHVLSPTRGKYKAAAASSGSSPTRQQQHSNGHELRRSTRKLELEEEAQNGSDDNSDSELDEYWVDSDNEIAADDDDLFEEWVDEKFEAKKKKKSKWEQDSDYDTNEDLEELQDSDVEGADSAEELEVMDKEG